MAADDGSTSAQADAVVAKAIASILKNHPAAYESFEQAAAAAMEKAQSAKEDAAGKLLEIARTYPNSTVAGKAMIAAAEAYESAGDSRHAIRVLRDMWFKLPQTAEKARILESVARNYLVMAAAPRESAGDHGPMDNMEAAAAALSRATALPGDVKLEKSLKLRDGTTIAAGTAIVSALDAVRKYRGAAVAKALPDLQVMADPPKLPASAFRVSPPDRQCPGRDPQYQVAGPPAARVCPGRSRGGVYRRRRARYFHRRPDQTACHQPCHHRGTQVVRLGGRSSAGLERLGACEHQVGHRRAALENRPARNAVDRSGPHRRQCPKIVNPTRPIRTCWCSTGGPPGPRALGRFGVIFRRQRAWSCAASSVNPQPRRPRRQPAPARRDHRCSPGGRPRAGDDQHRQDSFGRSGDRPGFLADAPVRPPGRPPCRQRRFHRHQGQR